MASNSNAAEASPEELHAKWRELAATARSKGSTYRGALTKGVSTVAVLKKNYDDALLSRDAAKEAYDLALRRSQSTASSSSSKRAKMTEASASADSVSASSSHVASSSQSTSLVTSKAQALPATAEVKDYFSQVTLFIQEASAIINKWVQKLTGTKEKVIVNLCFDVYEMMDLLGVSVEEDLIEDCLFKWVTNNMHFFFRATYVTWKMWSSNWRSTWTPCMQRLKWKCHHV